MRGFYYWLGSVLPPDRFLYTSPLSLTQLGEPASDGFDNSTPGRFGARRVRSLTSPGWPIGRWWLRWHTGLAAHIWIVSLGRWHTAWPGLLVRCIPLGPLVLPTLECLLRGGSVPRRCRRWHSCKGNIGSGGSYAEQR